MSLFSTYNGIKLAHSLYYDHYHPVLHKALFAFSECCGQFGYDDAGTSRVRWFFLCYWVGRYPTYVSDIGAYIFADRVG